MNEPDENGWFDISTAPRDEGVSVLLGWDLEGNWPVCIGFWSGDYHGAHAWCDDATENDFTPQPTHWQPLPKPPLSTPPHHEGA